MIEGTGIKHISFGGTGSVPHLRLHLIDFHSADRPDRSRRQLGSLPIGGTMISHSTYRRYRRWIVVLTDQKPQPGSRRHLKIMSMTRAVQLYERFNDIKQQEIKCNKQTGNQT